MVENFPALQVGVSSYSLSLLQSPSRASKRLSRNQQSQNISLSPVKRAGSPQELPRTGGGLTELSLNSPGRLPKLHTAPSEPLCSSQIDLSWRAIDFGSVMCGRTLGSCISLVSHAELPSLVRLSLQSQQEHFKGADLWPLVASEDYIPSSRKHAFRERGAANSHRKFGCWYLEDPRTKDLVSTVSLVLKAKQSINVVVVLRAPERNVPGSEIGAMVNVKLLESEHVSMQRIFLFGKMEKFPIKFPKEVSNPDTRIRVTPIAFKFVPGEQTAAQKFKLPLKNIGDQDTELSIVPMRGGAVSQVDKSFDVFVIPGTVSLGPGGTGFVNLVVKMNLPDGVKLRHGDKFLKALVASAKSSSLVYGLYLQVQLVEASVNSEE